jgi:hypothetical protein
LSKIGAEPAQQVLQRVGVVNLPIFPSSLTDKAPSSTRSGIFDTSRSVRGVRICDTPMPRQFRGNHCEDVVRARAHAGLDIAKPIVEIVDHVDEWIADVTFSTKTLFARSGLHTSCSL